MASFRKNVATLMSGTVLAQVATAAASPVLTRLYPPEQMGIAAVFASTVAILGSAATARYDQAVLLPEEDRDAAHLVLLALLASVVVTWLSALLLIPWREPLALLLGEARVAPWLFLAPLAVFVAGLDQVLSHWCLRRERFRALATTRLVATAGGAAASIALGFAGLGVGGLILGPLAVHFLAQGALLVNSWRADREALGGLRPERARLRAMASLYRRFPTYDLGNALSYTVSLRGVVFLLSAHFGAGVVGLYAFAERIVLKPFEAFTGSFAQALYPRLAAAQQQDPASLGPLVDRSVLRVAQLVTLPFVAGVLLSPYIAGPIFGEEWAGLYAYIYVLGPALYAGLVFSPTSYVLNALNRPDVSFRLHAGLMVARLGTLALAPLLGCDGLTTLYCFSLATFAGLMLRAAVTYRYAGIGFSRVLGGTFLGGLGAFAWVATTEVVHFGG